MLPEQVVIQPVPQRGGTLAIESTHTHTHRFLFPLQYSAFATAVLGPQSLKKKKKKKVPWDLEILFM